MDFCCVIVFLRFLLLLLLLILLRGVLLLCQLNDSTRYFATYRAGGHMYEDIYLTIKPYSVAYRV